MRQRSRATRMPYARAHFWVVGLLMLLTVAFWPSYFVALDRLPTALHIHGATSTFWLLLVVIQSWSIQNGQTKWHKQFGLTSLVVFPFFLAGLFLVIYNNAVGLANSPDLARIALGPAFSAVSAVVILTVSYLYYSALKTRRHVHLHAGYMLAIPILLIEPVTSRLFNQYLPGLLFSGAADMENVINASRAYYLSIVLAIILTIWLYARNRERGRPFLFLAVMLVAQGTAYTWLGRMDWWANSIMAISFYPLGIVIACGVALGVIITYLGWWQGSRPLAKMD